MFLIVCTLVDDVLSGARPSVTLLEIFPNLSITFTVEPLGMLFGLVASGLWIVNSIYSIGYMRGNNEKNQKVGGAGNHKVKRGQKINQKQIHY